MTTHYAQLVWLDFCVRFVGRKWQAHPVNLLKTVATLDQVQGLQAPVILASLVSPTLGIMQDIRRSNTLTSRAQPELLLDLERIMANTRKDEVSVRVKDPLGNIVKPRLLGVILPDFTEWALPYVPVEDDGQESGD